MANSICSLLFETLKESLNRGDEAASIDSTEDGQIRVSFAILEVFPRQKAGVFKQCCSSLGLQPTGSFWALSREEEKTWQASMNANVPCVSNRHFDGAWKHSCPFRNLCLMREPLNNTQARTWGVLLPSAEGKYNWRAFKSTRMVLYSLPFKIKM